MKIKVWSDFSKKLNSTKQPADGTEIEVKLKDSTSIDEPVFMLEGVHTNYNYVYVPTFSRYYFVDKVEVVSNNITLIGCTVDRLASFKTDIGNYEAYIIRSSSNYDVDVRDNLISAKQKITHSETAETTIDEINLTGSYVLRVQGKNGVDAYSGSAAEVRNVLNFAYDVNNFASQISDIDIDWIASEEGKQQLAKLIFEATFNPNQYIASYKWFPFAVEGPLTDVYLGFNKCGQLHDKARFAEVMSGTISLPSRYYNDFRDFDNTWSRYSIYIPGIGETTLDASSLSHGNLQYHLSVDYETGYATCILKDGSGAHISTLTGVMGVDAQIGFAPPMQAIINAVSGIANNSIDKLAEPITTSGGGRGGNVGWNIKDALKSVYNPRMQVGSTETDNKSATIGKAIVNTVSTFATALPQFQGNTSIVGMPGNRGTIIIYNKIVVSVQHYGPKTIPITTAGRPLYEVKKINTLSGFVQCSGASIDISGLAGDKEEVNAYLNNGFYYE